MKNFGLIVLGTILTISSLGNITQAQFSDQTKTNLGDVLIRFCNNVGTGKNIQAPTKMLKLETETGNKKDICLYIQNSGPTDTTVKLNFVDGTITADDSQNKACQPEETKENFGQYVLFAEEERVFNVPAGSRVERHAQIEFPEGYAGMSYGCATLQIEGESITKTDGMFNILNRRANFIDILVHGEIISDLKIIQQDSLPFPNIGGNNKFSIYQDPDTKKYTAKVIIKNNGNVTQLIKIEPFITTRFGKTVNGRIQEKETIIKDENNNSQISKTPFFTRTTNNNGKITNRKVLPNNEVAFTFPLDGAIPFWQGKIFVNAKVTTSPVIDFGTKEERKKTSKVTTQELSAEFLIIPWNIITTICTIIILLWIFIVFSMKKKKKHTHNQQK